MGQQLGALGGGGAMDNFITSFANGGTGKIEYGVCEQDDLHSVREFALWFLGKVTRDACKRHSIEAKETYYLL